MKAVVVLAMLVLLSAPVSAEPDERTKAEIAHLFTHLSASNCEFFRNGSWYAAPRAAEHLKKKYEYLIKRGLISTTESFIERAATRSSVSRQPYLVRCEGAQAMDSGKWFTTALLQHRAASRQPAP